MFKTVEDLRRFGRAHGKARSRSAGALSFGMLQIAPEASKFLEESKGDRSRSASCSALQRGDERSRLERMPRRVSLQAAAVLRTPSRQWREGGVQPVR